MKKTITALLAAAAVALPGVAAAQDFYKGKTITYIVATDPGGGYDTYGRLIGKYLEKYLGAKVLIKNIPGAGHIVGTNTLYASKPDGLTIGTFNTGLIYAQILQQEGIQFDLRKMEWIGKAASDPRTMILSAKSGLKTFDDVKNSATPVKFAASGVGSASYTDTQLVASGFDLPIEVVPGFNGNEGELAMLRGEIAGQVGSLSSLRPFVENGYGTFALVIGGKVEGVPQGMELAQTDKAKSIIGLVTAMSTVARLTAAPPDTPADRVKELRDAYAKALADPDLLAEAKKLDIPIEPAIGDDVTKLVNDALNQSPDTVEIIAAAVNAKPPLVTVKTPLTAVGDGGKEVEFMSGDASMKASVSGSRTKITIDGKDDKRGNLKVGMTCEISFDPQNPDHELASMACGG